MTTITVNQTAKLFNGKTVKIVDRRYITRRDGETVLISVASADGARIPASEVHYCF